MKIKQVTVILAASVFLATAAFNASAQVTEPDQKPEQTKQQVKTTTKDGDTKTQVQSKTKETVLDDGTTITDSQIKIKTQEAGEAPDRTMIKKRTVTMPDGTVLEKEFYNDFEVLRDDKGRIYYMDKEDRIYFPDEVIIDERGAGELERQHNMEKVPDTRDDRDPSKTPKPKQ